MAVQKNPLHRAASFLRFGRGLRTGGRLRRDPERPLELYEYEGCPYCKKVREALCDLDLDYVCHPCARGSANRERVRALGGALMFPFLHDPNTDRRMNESEDIITYLYETYGDGRGLAERAVAPLNTLASAMSSALRPGGSRARRGLAREAQPPHLLELWSYEGSPFCRNVRVALATLDLDHVVHNVARGSRHRPALVARGGRMQVPFLLDPNTGVQMYESDDIVAYLERTYADG